VAEFFASLVLVGMFASLFQTLLQKFRDEKACVKSFYPICMPHDSCKTTLDIRPHASYIESSCDTVL